MPYYTREMVRWMRKQERIRLGLDKDPDEEEHHQTAAAPAGGGGHQTQGNQAPPTQAPVQASPVVNVTAPPSPQTPTANEEPVKVMRITPGHVDEDARQAMSRFEEREKADENRGLTFDEKRLKYWRNLLRLQVERIHKIELALPADGGEYKKYHLDLNGQPTRVGHHSKTYTARNRDHITVPMVVKVYEGGLASFANPLYLKFLRHLR